MTSFLQAGRPPLILASSSESRAKLLEAAGLSFIAEPPGLDESAMRQAVGGDEALALAAIYRPLSRGRRRRGAELGRRLSDRIHRHSVVREDRRRLFLHPW